MTALKIRMNYDDLCNPFNYTVANNTELKLNKMTPEELLEKILRYPHYMRKGESYPDANLRLFNEKVKLIQQAKSEWCKEQREFCAGKFRDCCEDVLGFDIIEFEILNAPEPN